MVIISVFVVAVAVVAVRAELQLTPSAV